VGAVVAALALVSCGDKHVAPPPSRALPVSGLFASRDISWVMPTRARQTGTIRTFVASTHRKHEPFIFLMVRTTGNMNRSCFRWFEPPET